MALQSGLAVADGVHLSSVVDLEIGEDVFAGASDFGLSSGLSYGFSPCRVPLQPPLGHGKPL
jgi:hypothetical protein